MVNHMPHIASEIFERNLRDVEEAISELKSISLMEEEEFIRFRRAVFSARYSIVLAVEAAADIGLALLEKTLR